MGLGETLAKQSKWDEAIVCYQKAIAPNPDLDSIPSGTFRLLLKQKYSGIFTYYFLKIKIYGNTAEGQRVVKIISIG